MGTWGEGLLEGDGPLDTLADLLSADGLEESPTHLPIGLGVHLLLDEYIDPDELVEVLDRRADWIANYPPATQEVLAALRKDTESVSGAALDAEVGELLGNRADAKRVDALLKVDGGAQVLTDLVTRCVASLDEMEVDDLYEMAEQLAPLAVLLRLGEVDRGLLPPKSLVATWRAAFEQGNEATTEERGFWDEYQLRVRKAFDLLESWALA